MAIVKFIGNPGDGTVYHTKSRRADSWDTLGQPGPKNYDPNDELRVVTYDGVLKGVDGDPLTVHWISTGFDSKLSNIVYEVHDTSTTHTEYYNGDYAVTFREAFIEIPGITAPSGMLLVASTLQLCFADNSASQNYSSQNSNINAAYKTFRRGGSVLQGVMVKEFDWGGGTVSDDKWRDISGFDGRFADGFIYRANEALGQGDQFMAVGSTDLHSKLKGASDKVMRFALFTDEMVIRNPGENPRVTDGKWQTSFWSANVPYDTNQQRAPKIILYSIPNSHLANVLGASIQLKDGSPVWAEFNPTARTATLKYKATPTSSPVTIYTIPIGTSATTFSFPDSYQGLDICCDDQDNIFLVAPRGDNQRYFSIMPLKRTVGTNNWVAGTMRTPSNINYYASFNNFSVDWSPSRSGRTGGVLYVLASHGFGYYNNLAAVEPIAQRGQFECSFAINFDAGVILNAGSGSSVISVVESHSNVASNSGSTADTTLATVSAYWPTNPVGSGMDLRVAGGNKAFHVTFDANKFSAPGGDSTVSMKQMIQNDTGDLDRMTSNTAAIAATRHTNEQTQEAATKMRLLDMHDENFVAYVENGVVRLRDSRDWSFSRVCDLTIQGITGFPSKAALNSAACWDAFHDKATNTIWIYYVDSQNPRRILAMGIYVTDWTLINKNSPREVVTGVGASGSSIVAIRAPRKKVDERWIHIDVASVGADGTPSLLYVDDFTYNQAPIAPVVNDVIPFKGNVAGPISWVFKDPNSNDVQLAYQIQVRRVSDNASVYDSGYVAETGTKPANNATVTKNIPANTLTNSTLYQVRVRTYDLANIASPWGSYKNFATAGNGGTVAITSPATDNAALTSSSLAVSWSFTRNASSNSPQASFRIRVYRTSDNALLQDSGSVISTNTNYTLSGLVSDVEQRIEIVVTDAAGEPSAPGIRLVTPSFGRPAAPSITVEPNGPFIRVRIINPAPGTDQPQVIRNEIYRKRSNSSTWVKIGIAVINGVYDDYAVASGHLYDYKVIGVA